jgi:tRNA1Val (adenine37-N6)-methyltransferase
MGNTWFKFKQFTVHQQKNAMKVTTDACLFGSLFPHFQPSDGIKMLDIGTGTGLLSLMAAQKNPGAHITAVEINQDFAEEASGNFVQSPFSDRIGLVVSNILDYQPVEPFTFIFSNPPFFEKQLPSPKAEKNLVHHSSDLTIEALLFWIKKWLHPLGTASILIPYYREEEIIRQITGLNMKVSVIFRLKQTPAHPYFRSILRFQKINTKEERIVIDFNIKDAQNQYTKEFAHLLNPFYLNL